MQISMPLSQTLSDSSFHRRLDTCIYLTIFACWRDRRVRCRAKTGYSAASCSKGLLQRSMGSRCLAHPGPENFGRLQHFLLLAKLLHIALQHHSTISHLHPPHLKCVPHAAIFIMFPPRFVKRCLIKLSLRG